MAMGVIMVVERPDGYRFIDSQLMPCSVCSRFPVIAYADLKWHIIRDNDRNLQMSHDWFLCDDCLQKWNAGGDSDLAEIFVARKRAKGSYADLDAEAAARERFAEKQGIVRRSLAGRGFTDIRQADYRFGYRDGVQPGTLPAFDVSDGEADAHRWLLSTHVDINNHDAYRRMFNQTYSYGIPNVEALDAIIRHSPFGVVDYGAGPGYWTWLLRKREVSVKAIDVDPQSSDLTRYNGPPAQAWTDVDRGGAPRLSHGTAKRTLLLVWPPDTSEMAYEALDLWKGNTLAYVGEWFGATATPRFHRRLQREFELLEEVRIPTFYGFYDLLMIFKR